MQQAFTVSAFAYRTENHMQWHRNIEIECIIVAHAHYEEHHNQQQVITETNS